MNKQEISEILRENKGGKYERHSEGAIGNLTICEVWVFNGVELETRFLAVPPNKNPAYFNDFTTLCNDLDRQSPSNMQAESQIQIQRFSSYVGAFVFLIAVITTIYIVTTQNEIKLAVVPFFLGLIASGGALFFGRWIMPRTGITTD